jgi:predicted DNA-binding WGR domain protein
VVKRRRCSKCGKAGHYKVTCKKRSGKKSKVKAKKSKVKRDKGSGGWINFYHGGRTGKIWSYKIESSGKKARVVVRWGRRVGPYLTKAHGWTSKIGAIGKASALIASKIRKGYFPVL